MKRVILIAAAACLLCACKTTPMTLSDFNGMCRFGQDNNRGCGGSAGCSEFEAVISQTYANADACLAACDVQYRDLRGSGGCSSRVGKARSLCERFCRSNY